MNLLFEHEIEYIEGKNNFDYSIQHGEFAEWGYVNGEISRFKLNPIETDYLVSPDRKSDPNTSPKNDYLHGWNV